MLPNIYPKISMMPKQYIDGQEVCGFKQKFKGRYRINRLEATGYDASKKDVDDDYHEGSKFQSSLNKQWNRFSQGRRGFRPSGKRVSNATDSLNYSGKDLSKDLQLNGKGTIEDFTWKLSAVRFPLRGSNGSWMSDSFHTAVKVTGADPVKFLMSGRSMECSRCDNLGCKLYGDDHTDDDMSEKPAESIEAFDQTPSRRDTHTVNCETSETSMNGSIRCAAISQTRTARELPPPMSVPNTSLNTHVNQNNITDTIISRNSNGNGKCTNKRRKSQSTTHICRKSLSITTIVSETIDTDSYSLVISQGCNKHLNMVHFYESDSPIVFNVEFFSERCPGHCRDSYKD